MNSPLLDLTAEALEALALALLPDDEPKFCATRRQNAPDPDTYDGYLVIANPGPIAARDDDLLPAIADAEIQILHYATDQDKHLRAQRILAALPAALLPGSPAIATLEPPCDALILYAPATPAAPLEAGVTDTGRLTLSLTLTVNHKPLLVKET